MNTISAALAAPALEAMSQNPEPRAAVIAEFQNHSKRIEEVNELLSWLLPARKPLRLAEALDYTQYLKGLPESFVEGFFRDVQTRSVGHPHDRQLYIDAFDLMVQSKESTLGKVTRKLCRCGEAHGDKCEQHASGIRSLKKLLRKHAPDLVERYDTLHPDRAKKVHR